MPALWAYLRERVLLNNESTHSEENQLFVLFFVHQTPPHVAADQSGDTGALEEEISAE